MSDPYSHVDEILLRAYYRGKDNKSYSDFELRQDKRQLEQTLLEAMPEEKKDLRNYKEYSGLEHLRDHATPEMRAYNNGIKDCIQAIKGSMK